jgi:hypothetical protein
MTTTLRNFPPENWNNFNFNQLRELASEISDEAGRSASTIESCMKSLAKDLKKILDAESRRDIDSDRFDWRLWHGPLIQAREALVAIEKAVSLLKARIGDGLRSAFLAAESRTWPIGPLVSRFGNEA